MKPIQIRFFTRPSCCLCDRALEVLRGLQREFALQIEIVDISISPELLDRYGRYLPVATLDQRELFRYEANEQQLRTFFRAQRQNRGVESGDQTEKA